MEIALVGVLGKECLDFFGKASRVESRSVNLYLVERNFS